MSLESTKPVNISKITTDAKEKVLHWMYHKLPRHSLVEVFHCLIHQFYKMTGCFSMFALGEIENEADAIAVGEVNLEGNVNIVSVHVLIPLITSVPEPRDVMEPPLLLAGLNILVVDDDDDSRFYITTVLETDGATVMAVASAAIALKVLTELQPHVLICDIAMPSEDGYTFIRKIRSLKANIWGKLPAIALTAYSDSEYRIRALEAGFQTHVAKPVDPEELVAIVVNLVTCSKS